jgi:hypothetical protein
MKLSVGGTCVVLPGAATLITPDQCKKLEHSETLVY